jgi:hypothetical protein
VTSFCSSTAAEGWAQILRDVGWSNTVLVLLGRVSRSAHGLLLFRVH